MSLQLLSTSLLRAPGCLAASKAWQGGFLLHPPLLRPHFSYFLYILLFPFSFRAEVCVCYEPALLPSVRELADGAAPLNRLQGIPDARKMPWPPKRMRGEEDHAGDAQHYPTTAGMRHTQGKEGGRAEGKLILKFPSSEIEAHVPIMKYFLPFHGSSVIPDGREPGKTDPPCSHPQRLTARPGTNKGFVLPGCSGSPPPAWTPYSIPQTQPPRSPSSINGKSVFPWICRCRTAAAWPPQQHPGPPGAVTRDNNEHFHPQR